MIRKVALVLLLVACGGPSVTQIRKESTDRNVLAHDKARDELLLQANGARFDPVLAVVEMNQQVTEAGGVLGLRPGEGLYKLADGELAFMPHTCVRGDSCGCEVSREYIYLRREDGAVVIARLTPKVMLRPVHVARCSVGCGQPSLDRLKSAARLGIQDASKIRFEERTYPFQLVVETCDRASPRA